MKNIRLHELYQSIISQSMPVFGMIKGCTYQLLPQKQPEKNSFSFGLSIFNSTQHQISFNQSFPNFEVQIATPLFYFLSSNHSICSSNPITFEANYGGKMQFPFISLKQKNGQFGLMLAFTDLKGRFKEIRFKLIDSVLKISVIYYDLKLEPKQTLYLPSFTVVPLDISQNFIEQSIKIFKNISSNPLIPNPSHLNSQFRSSFVLRVIELFEIQWNIKHKRVQQPPTQQINLANMVEEDSKLIGPIKFIHLRDWSANGDDLKTKFGNYFKPNLVGPQIDFCWLRNQIRYIQNVLNIGVGLYIQGYLVSKNLFDQQEQQKLTNMELRDDNGNPYTIWGKSNFTMCSSCSQWQHLLASTLEKIYAQLQCQGFYIDEYGFGSKTSHYKACTHILHNHQHFDLQTGQFQTLKCIAQKTQRKPILYIQQTPNDITMNQINGQSNQIPLLIDRFINPSFKIYELITEYTMASEDVLKGGKIIEQNVDEMIKGIMAAFWNGNGIYVPKNLQFYDIKVLEVIKKLNTAYLYYKDFFARTSTTPLANFKEELGINQILKNKFRNQNQKDIYTLINWSSYDQNEEFDGRTIKMKPFSLGIYHYDYQYLFAL